MVNMNIYAAYCFGFLTAVTVLFQLALALGAPWGEMAMGGRYPGKMPLRMRIAALIQILLLILIAAIVFIRAELIFENYYLLSEKLIWLIVAFCGLGAILNTITPSKKERRLWAPVAIVLLICSVVIALS